MIPEIGRGIFVCYKKDCDGGVGGRWEDGVCGRRVMFAGISGERFLECASLRHEEELDLRRLIVSG
jgi:hypothetical protein